MATINQIRGMLLEEAILYLLRISGYRTIEDAADDETLRIGRAGIEVVGRGGAHQIDAIADFSLTPPFSYSQRLLLEAKCYHSRTPVSLAVIRNAVGVLRDVEEHWFTTNQDIPEKKTKAPARRRKVVSGKAAAYALKKKRSPKK